MPTTTAAAKLTSAKQDAITFEGIVEHSFAHRDASPLTAFYMKRARCEVAELKKSHFIRKFACNRRSARHGRFRFIPQATSTSGATYHCPCPLSSRRDDPCGGPVD